MGRVEQGTGSSASSSRRRWIGFNATTVTVLVAALVVLITLLFIWQISLATRQDRLLQSLGRATLEDQKLREEIRSLQHTRGLIGSIPAYGALLTALGTGIALVTAARKQLEERTKDREQREKEARAEQERREAAQRAEEAESVQRFNESARTMIDDLASSNSVRRTGAAASLMTSIQTLLRPESSDAFKDAVFFFTVATMRIAAEMTPDIRRLLVRAFEKAIRLRLTDLSEKDRQSTLDLSRCVLERVDLAGLDLSYADVAFARLSEANLKGARMWRVKGYEVHLERARLSRAELGEARLRKAQAPGAHFHEANLVAARLEEADLTGAQFFRARLQSAHFEGADLTRARFEQADLNDAYFRGAIVDARTLDGLVGADWRDAHFSPDIDAELHRLSKAKALEE
jgi:uncharacterized protein YjbI with pentapeptide repeats